MRGPSRLLLLAPCASAVALSGCLSGKDDSLERERRARTMFEDLITRERHRNALMECVSSLEQTGQSLQADLSEDLIAVDLNHALAALGSILGKNFGDDLLDQIFDDFCIGK